MSASTAFKQPMPDDPDDRNDDQQVEETRPQPPPAHIAKDAIEPRLISDRPISDSDGDRLDYGRYAAVIAAMIQDPLTRLPMTIGINAPWGAGKSSLANMIADAITEDRSNRWEQPYIVCNFNAWAHEDASSLAGPFIATVARTADEERSYWNRLFFPLPYRYRSPRWTRWSNCVWAVAGLGLAIGAAFYLRIHPKLLSQIGAWLPFGGSSAGKVGGIGGISLTAVVRTLYEKVVVSGRKSVGSLINNPETSAQDATLAEAKDALTHLIKQSTRHWRNAPGAGPLKRSLARFASTHVWVKKVVGLRTYEDLMKLNQAAASERRFVIIVDDIERVEPPRGISILEAINQLLDDAPVITVLLGDMRMIGAAAGLKYEKLSQALQRSDDEQYGRARQLTFGNKYLQKIVQLQFDLPSSIKVSREAQQRMIGGLLFDSKASSVARRPLALIQRDFRRVMQDGDVDPAHKKLRNRGENFKLLRRFLTFLCLSASVFTIGYGVFIFASAGGLTWLSVGSLGASLAITIALYFLRRIADRDFARCQAELRDQLVQDTAKTLRLTLESAGRLQDALSQKRAAPQAIQEMLNDHALIRKARTRALADLAWSPRAIKRIENALKLYCVIAEQNNLFQAGLTEEQIGKWIGLRERWPRLAQEGMIRRQWFSTIETDPRLLCDKGHFAIDEVLDGLETSEEQRQELCDYLKWDPLVGKALDLILCLPYLEESSTLVTVAR